MSALASTRDLLKLMVNGRHVLPKPKDKVMSFPLMIEKLALKRPFDVMAHFEGQTLTWGQLNKQANKFAHLLKSQGIKKGDRVALLMENRLEFLAACMGISKLGAVAALINTSLTGKSLIHCITSVNSKKLIVGEEVFGAIYETSGSLELAGKDIIFVSDQMEDSAPSWCTDFSELSVSLAEHNPAETQKVSLSDDAFLIFTSGTTGLPKAAVMSHGRADKMAMSSAKLSFLMTKKDCMYICLPLYHGSALLVGFGGVIYSGASMFLRRKFSASQFLIEARRYKTTCFLYIGELCRYLLNQPLLPNDGINPIRAIAGNGLRPDIWHEFKNRYKIHRINEFYGASEGNAGFGNSLNKDCTFGFCLTPFAVVKFDVQLEAPIRNHHGYCQKVDKYESGLLLTKIGEKYDFEGYTDEGATEKKILRNVFESGDAYFDTGDLIRQVDVGFAFGIPHYQFVDRVGDTFRWKGQNVSTNEVDEILHQLPQVEFSNVYGVQVPGTDGRAGMAAISTKREELDLAALSQLVDQALPNYARPLFVRVLQDMDATQTFKLRKVELREEAFHLDKSSEDIYVLKPGKSNYEPLDEDFYQTILAGKAGF